MSGEGLAVFIVGCFCILLDIVAYKNLRNEDYKADYIYKYGADIYKIIYTGSIIGFIIGIALLIIGLCKIL
jgi:hypothetical protein